MIGNGKRRPPRPRIEAIAPAPSDEQAAAIAAAVERFLVEAAPTPPAPEAPSAWQRAAIREGVHVRAGVGSPWGEPGGWGATGGQGAAGADSG